GIADRLWHGTRPGRTLPPGTPPGVQLISSRAMRAREALRPPGRSPGAAGAPPRADAAPTRPPPHAPGPFAPARGAVSRRRTAKGSGWGEPPPSPTRETTFVIPARVSLPPCLHASKRFGNTVLGRRVLTLPVGGDVACGAGRSASGGGAGQPAGRA